jgi:hypothetical protein
MGKVYNFYFYYYYYYYYVMLTIDYTISFYIKDIIFKLFV